MNYLDSIQSDEEIEGRFRYEMPDDLKELSIDELYYLSNELTNYIKSN